MCVSCKILKNPGWAGLVFRLDWFGGSWMPKALDAEGTRCWRHWCRLGLGRGLCPLLEKNFVFYFSKWCILMHFGAQYTSCNCHYDVLDTNSNILSCMCSTVQQKVDSEIFVQTFLRWVQPPWLPSEYRPAFRRHFHRCHRCERWGWEM